MSVIDVRQQKAEVRTIVFADPPESSERNATYKLFASAMHPEHIFIEDGCGEYEVIRRKDVPYLIKALQAAQDLWEGCK